MPTKPLLGNWQEELAYEADRKNLHLTRREMGTLISQQIIMKIKQHTSPCQLGAIDSDGFLRFGVPVSLKSVETCCFLSVDMDDKYLGPNGWKVVGSTGNGYSQLRNSWVMVPVPSEDDAYWQQRGEADIVHYGQKFLISSVSELADPPIFLTSEMKSPSSVSRITSNQEVYFSSNGGLGSYWVVEFGNPEYREDVEGQPAKAESVFIIKHAATNNFLASFSKKFVNDFGVENEICCSRVQEYASKAGKAPEQKSNFWTFVHNQ
jgi:hypothetical protein